MRRRFAPGDVGQTSRPRQRQPSCTRLSLAPIHQSHSCRTKGIAPLKKSSHHCKLWDRGERVHLELCSHTSLGLHAIRVSHRGAVTEVWRLNSPRQSGPVVPTPQRDELFEPTQFDATGQASTSSDVKSMRQYPGFITSISVEVFRLGQSNASSSAHAWH